MEKYEVPVIEVIVFDTKDVIITSGPIETPEDEE